MITCKNYSAPEIEIVMITDDVVRTSLPGTGEGELPVQPIGNGGWAGF